MPTRLRISPLSAALLLAATFSLATPILKAQSTPPSPPQQQPDSDGPASDQGPIVVPKKKPAENSSPPASTTPETNPLQSTPSILTSPNSRTSPIGETPEVAINAGVLLEKPHTFLPGLKPSNFRLYEDGQEQKVIGFSHSETPIAALMLCEYASTGNQYLREIRNNASNFAAQLGPQDYIALMTFNIQTQIVADFTQDKTQLTLAIHQLPQPAFSESNLYDALYDGLDRLSRIDGQKYILLLASGRDTSSKITLDKILDKVRQTPDVTIFTISTSGLAGTIPESSPIGHHQTQQETDHAQADSPLRTFAQLSGGLSFTPRLVSETPDDFKIINEAIRSSYELIYHPTNPKQDGAYRRIQVELVDDQGQPLKLEDEKHKPLQYAVVVREGYRATQAVK